MRQRINAWSSDGREYMENLKGNAEHWLCVLITAADLLIRKYSPPCLLKVLCFSALNPSPGSFLSYCAGQAGHVHISVRLVQPTGHQILAWDMSDENLLNQSINQSFPRIHCLPHQLRGVSVLVFFYQQRELWGHCGTGFISALLCKWCREIP